MISIVIITKNEGHIIGQTLAAITAISDDIVIVDSGSTDDTLRICEQYHCNLIKTGWDGYGANKNKGIAAAKNDWILSVDADEVPDQTMISYLQQLQLTDANIAYTLKFHNYFCGKKMNHGVWGSDYHVRLFNRTHVSWNNDEVHEKLTFPQQIKIVRVKGAVQHYTVNNLHDYIEKTTRYAQSSAFKYFSKGKKAGWIKRYFSPAFTFLKHYVFRLGFLDGWEGFVVCKTFAWYTFLKYSFLHELQTNKNLNANNSESNAAK